MLGEVASGLGGDHLTGAKVAYNRAFRVNSAMKKVSLKLLRRKGRLGATLFEYVVIVSIISIVGVVLLSTIGHKTSNSIVPVNDGLQ